MKKLLLLSALILFSGSWAVAQTEDTTVKPPNGLSELQAYGLFRQHYKNDNYEDVIKFGKWMWKAMPTKIEGYPPFDLNKELNKLSTAYSGYAQEVQDPTLKRAYVDSALLIADRAMQKYTDDENVFDWRIKRGRILQSNVGIVDNANTKAAEEYFEAYQTMPKAFTERSDGYYMKSMIEEFVDAGKKDEVLAIIKETESYASSSVNDFYDDVRNDLFSSPKERITFLEGELEAEPENKEVLSQLRDLYQDQEMTAKATEVSQKLYELDPTFENTMAVSDVAISNANYSMAVKYLKEAMSKASEDKERAEIAIKISSAYMNKEELRTARDFARQAIDYDNDWGKPYIQIADIYAQAVSQCTNNRKMERKDKTVYWLVLDYLDKAKRVDSNTASEVDRKYKSYQPVTPSAEEKFFWDPPLEAGDEFKINSSLMDCYGWINETTSVR